MCVVLHIILTFIPDQEFAFYSSPIIIFLLLLLLITSSYDCSHFPSYIFYLSSPTFHFLAEPSLEVAEYLKEACVNKIIVGHQPRGDAPLVIDLGTGIQVRERECGEERCEEKGGGE